MFRKTMTIEGFDPELAAAIAGERRRHQRLGADARRRRAAQAARRRVRIDRSAPHTALVGPRKGTMAASRVQSVLPARMSAGSSELSAATERRTGIRRPARHVARAALTVRLVERSAATSVELRAGAVPRASAASCSRLAARACWRMACCTPLTRNRAHSAQETDEPCHVLPTSSKPLRTR